MRKEVYSDHPTISWVLDHCKILRLGLTDERGTYVVPVNYGYEDVNGTYVLYVHGTSDGQKGHALNQESLISFETDGGHEHLTYTPPKEGAFGPAFRSVMGHGQVSIVTDADEKSHALRTMLHHYVLDIPVAIHPEKVAKVPVWKITVVDVTARVHHPTAEWQAALGINAPIATGLHYDAQGAVQRDDREQAASEVDDVSGASQRTPNQD
ncbi:pyridoxamine 5'-phosphate oxidase family protein [Lactiplantibacillus garii]|nr:pyridoxamine 5'-phosphate oxidase family protein [Lactiplantibacillus garii]